jgi:hypothetical protein
VWRSANEPTPVLKTKVWCGLLHATFIGNFSFLEPMITGNTYLEKLENFKFAFLKKNFFFQINMEYRLLTAELFVTQ